jgi:gamma-glutamyltranspeptidase/glutathione hydrolase
MNRRTFVRGATLVGLAAGATAPGEAQPARTAPDSAPTSQPKQGPKPVTRGKRAVCSTDHPLVTSTILKVMREGGNAADAAVAGSLAQAALEPHMTNHTGSVNFLYYDAKTGSYHELISTGVLPSGLAAFRPIPPGVGFYGSPMACIPGFMPGIGAIHERFGTKPWARLCEDAIRYADEGHTVSSWEFYILYGSLGSFCYFPSGRELFTPSGFVPQVGDTFRNPELARTLRRLAEEGPAYFTTGEWGARFVSVANEMGWAITASHMTAVPPRWGEPLRYRHGDYEIVQYSPPERQGVFTALVLGVLAAANFGSLGHYTESPEALYLMAHALRWAHWECGFLNDPKLFDVPLEVWLQAETHQRIAKVLLQSRPRIDLTEHVRLTQGPNALAAAGVPSAGGKADAQPAGSCELAIVDAEGNWVQMMNTLQSGGIPGMVIDGVPMVGSHAAFDMRSPIAGWLTGEGRIRCVVGSTMLLEDGRPRLSLGSPGNVYITVPQVLSNIVHFDQDPYDACVQPRMRELRDDYVLEIESRLPEATVAGLARMGIAVKPLPMYDDAMGSFQIAWRDRNTGLLSSSADPRRAGEAGGY